jgi:site-specific recombinase XerD
MKLTLSEVTRDFINAKKAERLSPLTIKSYRWILQAFSDFIGSDTPFTSVDIRQIRAYMASLVDVSDKTAANHHICLSSLWSFAVADGIVDDHIVRKINIPKYTVHRIIPFTEKEIRKILAHCKFSRDKAIIFTLLDTGVRASELIGLRLADWRPGYLTVFGKGRKERMVPMSERTDRAISRQVRLGHPDHPLFANLITGEPMVYDTLRSLMDRLEDQAGVPDVHAHRFRHTFAITFLRNAGDIYTLQKILGHSTLEMVKTYLDIARSDITRAHEKASPVKVWGL